MFNFFYVSWFCTLKVSFGSAIDSYGESKKKPLLLADIKIKSRFFSPLFIHIPIEPECSEMDNFEEEKTGCVRPPRHLYFKDFYGSPDYKNKHQRKMVLTKKKSWHAEYFFHFVWKKSSFSSGRGVEPHTPDSGHVRKKSNFLTPSL